MKDFFQENKEIIQEGLHRVASQAGLSGDLTLVEGLVFLDIQKDPQVVSIGGGLRIPIVVVIDNQTGKVHQFALKIICPNLNL
jgi:hypothetical protein